MSPIIIETFRWLVVAAVALSAGLFLAAWFRQEHWGKVAVTICAVVALLCAVVALLKLHP
jgi:O-antigen/teichoic acid export membrane protein